MRYLFFDIECCDGKHICEFGYVITDDRFHRLDKQVITINPEKPFCLSGRKNQTDITLFFTEKEYCDSPLFPVYYDRIKKLIEHPDQIVIGHAVGNDAMFLRTACQRYGLNSINFNFVDSQRIYSEFSNEKERISLDKAETIFNLEKPVYRHKSDEDAYLTAQLVEKMCAALEMTVQEVASLCPTACGKSYNFNITYTGNSLPELFEALDKNVNALSNHKKQKCIVKFSELAQSQGEIKKSKLTGTALCFDAKYEKEHIKETLKLIQLLADHGCRYSTKFFDCDFYVASREELEGSEEQGRSRYYSVTHRKDGRKVEILTFDELFRILGVTEDAISAMEMPKVPKKSKGNPSRRNYYSTGQATTTVGDVLRSRGVDLSKED